MRQILLNQPGEFSTSEQPRPVVGEGEALVRIHRIGVCGTDLHAFAGRQPFFTYPRVLGHELGVEVVEVAPNNLGVAVGDHCAVEPYLNNPSSHASRLGRPNCCEELKVLGVHVDGGMRGFLNVPIRLLHKSEKLSFEQLALVETLGIGEHAVERSAIPAGETALVIGAGPIGLAIAQFVQAAGATPVVADLSAPRRGFVADLGIEAIESPGDQLFDFVFDATGSKASMEKSFDYCAHGANLVFVGLVQDTISFHDPSFHRKELTLKSSRNSAHAFPKIIRMIEEGRIDTNPWVNHRLTLRNTPTEFAGLRAIPDLVKAVIEVDEGDL
ncbi:MAG: alcohol dehydrogenase catalytic domain-containing protein [Acidobacteria bacterium]|nr:alcohol dehydrogenase catalytic domain-containing protein [Acidobacteriota bacterium]